MKKTSPADPRRLVRLGAAVLVGCLGAASLATGNGGGSTSGGGALSFEDAWARASIGGSKVSAVYLVVANRGEAVDRLVGAETGRAARATIHRSVVEDGVAKMRHAAAVEVPPGGSVRFEPGGLHVMLTGVAPPLEAGERIPVTLVFERAGRLDLSVPVRRAPPR